ncbi:MAG: hypothetical protein EOP59_05295 [Sphingomonadales bacterium]|nr:MAG: hypothetical protein EOP59_05295 [Sphingomonadales bacterium]
MKHLLMAVAAVLALPAVAQEANPDAAIQAEPDEYVVRPLLKEATDAERRGDVAGALAKAEQAIALLKRPTPFRAWVNCLYGARMLERDKEKARRAIEECHAVVPDHPAAKMAYSRLLIEDGDKAAGYRMVAAGIRSDPRWLAHCDTTTTGWIRTELRVLAYDRALDDVRAELIEALTGTACGTEDPAFYSGLMRDVIARRLARGDVENARAALPAVLDPDDLLKMLVERRFAPLWADIERISAGTLEPQRVAFVHKVRQGHAAAPNMASAIRLAYALDVTGGRAEGIALLAKSLADPGLASPERFEESTAAVRLADMRNAAGETSERLVTGPLRALLAKGSPEAAQGLWNVVPNLAQWLIVYDKPAEALALLDRYVPDVDGLDSPAAQAYFVALRGCAQLRKGQADGQQVLDRVIRDYPGNGGAIKIAATCGNDRKVLRERILALMEDEQARSGLLLDMLRIKLLGTNGRGTVSYEHRALASLLAEPEVAARFDALARDPGPGYRPALARWRAGVR